jgi:hypothetical protein|tara:strand:- start:307 stop:1161 length:855 start_codon:yes stop_codon:yes gene_type:complete
MSIFEELTNKIQEVESNVRQQRFDSVAENTDKTIGTSDKNIASIRTSLPFADLVFTFPVTEKNGRVVFPAFLQNHSENFSPSWNAQTVYGRNDPIPVYSNTTRTLSLSFKVPSHDAVDANENLKKLNRIIQNLYPSYKPFGSSGVFDTLAAAATGLEPNYAIVGAPLTRIKFANLVCNSDNPSTGLLGYISNLSVTMDPNNGYFMASAVSGFGDKPCIFPRILNFSFSFNPLHEHKIGWDETNNWLGERKTNFPFSTKKLPGEDAKKIIPVPDRQRAIDSIFGN